MRPLIQCAYLTSLMFVGMSGMAIMMALIILPPTLIIKIYPDNEWLFVLAFAFGASLSCGFLPIYMALLGWFEKISKDHNI